MMHNFCQIFYKIIEKHFTYDKTKKGNDHYHAYDLNDMKSFTERLNEMRKLFLEIVLNLKISLNQEKAIKNVIYHFIIFKKFKVWRSN